MTRQSKDPLVCIYMLTHEHIQDPGMLTTACECGDFEEDRQEAATNSCALPTDSVVEMVLQRMAQGCTWELGSKPAWSWALPRRMKLLTASWM